MPRNQKISAAIVVLTALAGMIYTVAARNEPLLGLDLQGGVSVVLEPTQTGAGDVTDETLDLTVELLRNRIDEIGVAEPEISRQGDNIVVALPGVVEDQEEALARLQQTAELRFRPVIVALGPALDLDSLNIETETDAGDDEGVDASDGDAEDSMSVPAGRFAPGLPAQDDTTTTTEPDDTTTTDTSDDATTSTVADDTADDTAEDTTDDTVADDAEGTDGEIDPDAVVPTDTLSPAQLAALEACGIAGLTPDDDDVAESYVVLASRDGERLCLGPTLLTGESVETASVGLGIDGWEVSPVFRAGGEGIDQFNQAAQICFNADPDTCPTRRLAIVLDHNVISAPSINGAVFSRDQIRISGSFEEDEARLLAESLRFGSLPLELKAQETRTVSATIGRDVLRSGTIAGLIGLALVAVYLLAYYRLAGLVAIGGLLLSGALLWTIVAWFGEYHGLALSLAGVVGLVVAIGVSADSNIVYFENVKESYASGRKMGTAIERAYQSAISTIVKADVVSLIAAVLLYLLTVGAVRGFAFYLGLATILDLIISWMFMRPALSWLAQRKAVKANPRLLGMRSTGGAQ